jgi:hypothetical protein
VQQYATGKGLPLVSWVLGALPALMPCSMYTIAGAATLLIHFLQCTLLCRSPLMCRSLELHVKRGILSRQDYRALLDRSPVVSVVET